jgi:predicted RNase H-like HicB family nuclease
MSQHYAYRVVYSQEDGAWVGLCTEFPSLSHLAATQVEAMQGIANLIAVVVDDMVASGEPLPEALSDRSYSGRFVTRVPEQLHRTLAIEAAEAALQVRRETYDLFEQRRINGLETQGSVKQVLARRAMAFCRSMRPLAVATPFSAAPPNGAASCATLIPACATGQACSASARGFWCGISPPTASPIAVRRSFPNSPSPSPILATSRSS